MEEHTCFSVLLWYSGLGKLCWERQWNLIRHFPELSTCSFLEYPCLALERLRALKSTDSGHAGCLDDLLAS